MSIRYSGQSDDGPSFNEAELLKIQKATKGFFKSKARYSIARYIQEFSPEVAAIKRLAGDEKLDRLQVFLELMTAERHKALQNGASGFADPHWASAAVMESWLLEIRDGSPGGIDRVERIINQMALP